MVTAQHGKYQQAHTQTVTRTRAHVSADYFSVIPSLGDSGFLNDDLLMAACLRQAATHLVSTGPISSLSSQSDTPTLPFALVNAGKWCLEDDVKALKEASGLI